MAKDTRTRQERRADNRRAADLRAEERARKEREEAASRWYAERGIPVDDDNPPVAQIGNVTFFRAFFGG